MEQVNAYSPDYLVLAKYMRILSANFVDQYAGRIVNIHHSFLPAFIGANPYKYAGNVCYVFSCCYMATHPSAL